MPISSNVEAAAVPSQLLGELFVQKGLITPAELEEALAEQKVNGKRLGEILVSKGYVSGPTLTTVLAEQLGVEMEKQEGFGAGLWSEIKKRHLRGRGALGELDSRLSDDLPEPLIPFEDAPRFAVIDGLAAEMDAQAAAAEPVDTDRAAELDELRQQLAFSAGRLDEERSSHEGTRRLLEEARSENATLAHEADDWRERAAAAQRQLEERGTVDQASTQLPEIEELRTRSEDAELALDEARAGAAALESTVAELRAELERRDRELTAAVKERDALEGAATARDAEVSGLREERRGSEDAIAALTTQVDDLRAELVTRDQELVATRELQATLEGAAAARDAELADLREEHESSRDAIAKLTTQVDELRAGNEQAQSTIDELRSEASAAAATVADLREELAAREQAGDVETALRAELAMAIAQLDALRARHEEAQQTLQAVREEANATEAAAAELREEVTRRDEQIAAEVAEARQEAARMEQAVANLRATVDAREQATAREAEGRADLERRLAELATRAEGLSSRLDEERSAHATTRGELERVQAQLADLQLLTDKVATTETELASCARLLEEVSTGLAAAKAEAAERADAQVDASRHLVFMPVEGVYSLAELPGPAPDVGAYQDVEGTSYRVARVGSSPLPADTRRCAFLEIV